MKIAFYLPYTIRVYGGETRWLIEVSRRLSDLGHEIVILGLDKGSYIVRNEVKLPSKVEYLELKSMKPFKGFPIPSHKEQHKLISMLNNTDIIYMFIFHLPNEILLTLKSRFIETPLIAGVHSLPLFKWYMKFYLALSRDLIKKIFDAFHVLNRYSRILLMTHKVPHNRVYMIPNGVDTSKYYIKHNDEKFRILWTGRHHPEKGVDILLKMITEFNIENPHMENEVEFVITGAGPYEKYVRLLASEFSNVKYLGYVDAFTLRKMYAISHLYLVTSRAEGMPLRVLEAMASGLPVVGSKIPGIQDVVLDGVTGKLVNTGDINAFCRDILEYYSLWKNSSEEYGRLRLRIRNYTVKNYDWSIIIDRIENMFRQVLLDRGHKF